jgi:DNA-binding NtrC family response regulator
LAEANGKDIKDIDQRTLRLLEQYHWPGNIRELQNVIEHAVAVADGPGLLPEHLPERIRYGAKAEVPTNGSTMKEGKQTAIESFERNFLVELLKKHRGHIGHAALEAGVNRKTVERLLKKHGLKAKDL